VLLSYCLNSPVQSRNETKIKKQKLKALAVVKIYRVLLKRGRYHGLLTFDTIDLP